MSAEPEPEPAAGEQLGLLEWFRGQEGCKLGSVEITNYEYEGRGVRATGDIKKGNPLYACPVKLLVSLRAAKAEPTLGPVCEQVPLRDDDVLALFLLIERRKGAASPHAEHIASLPTAYDQTVFWTDEELAEIAGSNVFGTTAQLKLQIVGDYAALQAAVADKEALAVAEFSLEDYTWALATIWSRAMDLPVAGAVGADGSVDTEMSTMRIIGPVCDMFNTRPGQPQVHGYMPSLDALTVAAGEDTVAGEQLFIGYGEVTNARAMWLYGFASDNNPADSVALYACMDTEAPSCKTHKLPPHHNLMPTDISDGLLVITDEKRMKLLKALKLSEQSLAKPHELSLADPLPKALLLSLRVQHAPKKLVKAWREDPEAFAAKKAPDAALERAVLDALRAGVVGMLEAYSTSLEDDEEAAARWAPHTQTLAAEHAYRQRMALLLRLGEKRILRGSIKAIDSAFNALNFGDVEESVGVDQSVEVAAAPEPAPA